MQIEIGNLIIDRMKILWVKHGFDLPETNEGWSDIVEDYLSEKLDSEFEKLDEVSEDY